MDFDTKTWGWVGDIYHKVESMIQEVDDIMKEKADPVGQNSKESSEDKKKFSFVEVRDALQRVKETHSPPTSGKKLEEGQEACKPPVNGITVEHDQSEQGHTGIVHTCKSTLNCGEVSSQVVSRNSEVSQSLMNDPKASESETATQVVGYVSRDSSMSLGFPSGMGEIDKPTASGMAMDMQDDKLEDSGCSTPSLVDLTKEVSVEYPGIHFYCTISDNNDDTSTVKEAVLEPSKCKDEVHQMLVNTGAVKGNNIDEREVVENYLLASPVRSDESHLHREVGETCINIERSGDSVTFAPDASSVNSSLVTITGKLMEQIGLKALTNDFFEKHDGDDSKLSNSPVSGTATGGRDEHVPLENLLEEDEGKSTDSGTSGAYSIDTNMETIDLDDEGKLQETCVDVDMRELFAVSGRVKRFRSIKRTIIDALASRRRKAKEYKQLGILQGEVNYEPDGHVMKSTVPFLDNRSQIEHADDSDWELL
ncbi:hypothetical protein MLD38_035154 [Melastoma candidum]|uniref:Uncharacterized protein n=1 Tax=Melastoma candidum TaxID=119954 RepID=A0ACB9MEG1_9MYRT|nr:hypothetical protein MLD38_035154 [Melastoma candidum]